MSSANLTPTPRGIRNHNPGNIDFSSKIVWDGQVDHMRRTDERFVEFVEPIYGLRAIGKILRTYQRSDGCRTIRDYIHRWAPRCENNTDAYVQAVAASLHMGAGDVPDITSPQVMAAFIHSIVVHENGYDPYPQDLLTAAVKLALA